MADFQTQKSIVRAFHADLATATPATVAEVLARAWADDMIWWGPAGIGAAFTIQRYTRQHAGPFNAHLADGYRFNGHLCRMAEGHFGGFFGWANLTLRNNGGYMGMTASPGLADMRVVDLYREADGLLAENWIFIDILHYLNMQGLDVLGRMASLDPAVQAESWDPPAR